MNWKSQVELNPEKLAISTYIYDRKVCETLEINELLTLNENDRTVKDLNRDSGDYVSTKT